MRFTEGLAKDLGLPAERIEFALESFWPRISSASIRGEHDMLLNIAAELAVRVRQMARCPSSTTSEIRDRVRLKMALSRRRNFEFLELLVVGVTDVSLSAGSPPAFWREVVVSLPSPQENPIRAWHAPAGTNR